MLILLSHCSVGFDCSLLLACGVLRYVVFKGFPHVSYGYMFDCDYFASDRLFHKLLKYFSFPQLLFD